MENFSDQFEINSNHCAEGNKYPTNWNGNKYIASNDHRGQISKIRVVVRKRPANTKEIQHNDIDIIETTNANTIIVKELKNKVDLTKYIEEHKYTFDKAYDETSTNQQIYNEIVQPMISAAFHQTKITCFAYGQTGSGKTFTMMGSTYNVNSETGIPGWYLLSARDLFTYWKYPEYAHLEVWVSFYEIYCNKLFDLLNQKSILQAREDGKGNICIVGLVEQKIANLQELMSVIDFGLRSRTTGITGANMDSSRSHAIMQILIKNKNGSEHGKISFIDLAGSERAVDTIDTNKQTKIDGAEINKSLLALKECIRALDQEKRHKPFRGSKLTLVLRDSFIGKCLTWMIANISPCLSCSEHTLNTLRYADRVKELRKIKGDRSATPDRSKDPNEVWANLWMMPRQHNKTLKYKIDIKSNNNPNTGYVNNYGYGKNNNNNNNVNKQNTGITHISDWIKSNIIQNNKHDHRHIDNTCTNYINTNTINKTNNNNKPRVKEITNQQLSERPRSALDISSNHTNNNIPTNSLKKESPQPDISINQYVSKYNNWKIKSNEDLEVVLQKHDSWIEKILHEEDEWILNHKNHIDEMADSWKEEMISINKVDQPGSNIDEYTANIDEIFVRQIEQILKMRKRFNNFQIMLKDQNALSEAIHKHQDIGNNNNNNNNHNNKCEIDLNEKDTIFTSEDIKQMYNEDYEY